MSTKNNFTMFHITSTDDAKQYLRKLIFYYYRKIYKNEVQSLTKININDKILKKVLGPRGCACNYVFLCNNELKRAIRKICQESIGNNQPQLEKAIEYFKEYNKALIIQPYQHLNEDSSKYYNEEYCILNKNTISDIENIYSDNHKYFAIIGDKGSGKSTIINCWLYRYEQDILSKNIIPLYINLYEYYQAIKNKNIQDISKINVNLSDYIKANIARQLLSAYDEKSNASTPLKQYFIDILENINDFAEFGKTDIREGGFSVSEIIERLKNKHILDDNSYKGKLLDALVPGSSRKAHRVLEHAGQLILENAEPSLNNSLKKHPKFENKENIADHADYFTNNQRYIYYLFIDGIDNINFTSNDEYRLFKYIIESIKNIINNDTLFPNSKIIFVMRERTWIQIISHDNQNDYTRDKIQSIFHDPTDPKNIYLAKTKLLSNLLNLNKPDILKINLFEKEYKVLLNEDSLDTHDLQLLHHDLKIYHNNIASLLSNLFTLEILIYYRWLQTRCPSNYSYLTMYKLFYERNLFLAGHFLICPSMQTKTKEGLYSKNIFGYGYPQSNNYNISTKSRLHTFAAVRILQYLINNHDIHLRDEEIINYISSSFNYDKDFLKYIIVELKAYGLLDTKVANIYDREFLHTEISKKGEYILTSLLSSIDVIYTLAIDTLIPAEIVDKIINGIYYLNNYILGQRSFYPEAVLSTGVHIFAYLIALNKYELKYIYKGNNKDMYDFCKYIDIDKIVKRLLNLQSMLDIL